MVNTGLLLTYLNSLFSFLDDDIVLLSTTVVGLQRQLNSLCTAETQLKLTVNIDKTKIIIFRNGGHLARNERLTYGSERMLIST